MEKTFSIIKPDATLRNITGKINTLIEFELNVFCETSEVRKWLLQRLERN